MVGWHHNKPCGLRMGFHSNTCVCEGRRVNTFGHIVYFWVHRRESELLLGHGEEAYEEGHWEGGNASGSCRGVFWWLIAKESPNPRGQEREVSRWAGFPFLDSTQRRIIFNWILGSQTGPVFFLKSDVLHCWSITMDHLKSISLCSFSNCFLHRGHKKPRLAHRERWAVWSADRRTISNYSTVFLILTVCHTDAALLLTYKAKYNSDNLALIWTNKPQNKWNQWTSAPFTAGDTKKHFNTTDTVLIWITIILDAFTLVHIVQCAAKMVELIFL